MVKDNNKNAKEIYIFDRKGTLKAVGGRLRHLRESLNVDVKTAAKESGVSHNMIQSYEQGKNEPKASTLVKLAMYYGTSVDFILFGDETNETIYKWTI